jgi:hypothetical protein
MISIKFPEILTYQSITTWSSQKIENIGRKAVSCFCDSYTNQWEHRNLNFAPCQIIYLLIYVSSWWLKSDVLGIMIN